MIVWACIAPHGGDVVPELAEGPQDLALATRRAMADLGARCLRAAPETIIVMTPHGVAIEDRVVLGASCRAAGRLAGPGGVIAAEHRVDVALLELLVTTTQERGVPTALAAAGPPDSDVPFPLDFGALIPLHFLGARWPRPPEVIVLCAAGMTRRRDLVQLGSAIAAAAERLGRRTAVLCSADQGHGHRSDGPYGFASASAPHDRRYCQAIRDNRLDRLLHWRADRVSAALTDSFSHTLVLHGVLRSGAFLSDLISYEAPTYFGMACAAFEPIANAPALQGA